MKYIASCIIASFFLLAVILPVRGEPAAAVTCSSSASGNWSSTSTWNCGHVPQGSDDVVVATGNTVTIDGDGTSRNIAVNGTLRFGNTTAARTLTVTGNITIATGATLRPRTTAVTNNLIINGDLIISGTLLGVNRSGVLNIALSGNWTKSGTFTAGTNTVTFNGRKVQTIGGSSATAFNNLVVGSGTRVIFPASNIPTVSGSMTVNAGGAVQQTQAVTTGTVSFLQVSTSMYRGVDISTTNNLGVTTVVITTTTSGGCTSSGSSSAAYATRCFEVKPTNNLTATVRLYALTATQLNGIAQSNLRTYGYSGSWQVLPTNASNGSATGGYSYAQADTTNFGDFLLGGISGPTAVTLSSLQALPQIPSPIAVPAAFGVVVCASLLAVIKRRAS